MTIAEITPDQRPNAQLVEQLEHLLALAKEGRIRSGIYCFSWHDDETTHGFSIDGRTWTKPLIGEITMLAHDVVNDEAFRSGQSVLSREIDGV